MEIEVEVGEFYIIKERVEIIIIMKSLRSNIFIKK